MEQRILGKTGLSVSVLGFGGAEIGFENISLEIVDRLLGSALDAGLNVIDTAECYLSSEELIGRAVGGRRKEYYLFTKCGHASDSGFRDWDLRLVEENIELSLKRLRTDYVDLVQLHSCSEEDLRQGDLIDVLIRAHESGKTRYIGYSGDGQAALYAVRCGAFHTLQTSINIADQEAIDLTLPIAMRQGMGVIAKRPIANVVWRSKTRPDDPYLRRYWDRLTSLDYEFLKSGLSEAVGISLRFTLSVPGVHTAIVGTSRPGRWHENADSVAAGVLSGEQFKKIRERWFSVGGASWKGEN